MVCVWRNCSVHKAPDHKSRLNVCVHCVQWISPFKASSIPPSSICLCHIICVTAARPSSVQSRCKPTCCWRIPYCSLESPSARPSCCERAAYRRARSASLPAPGSYQNQPVWSYHWLWLTTARYDCWETTTMLRVGARTLDVTAASARRHSRRRGV